MRSRTKHRLTRLEIVKLAANQFGDNTTVGVIKELKGGMFNSAYLLELPGLKQEVVLKVSVHPDASLLAYEKNLMRTEVEVYQHIASTTSIPIPDIMGYDFTRRLIPSDYFFMSALKGQTMHSLRKKLNTALLDKIKVELGGYISQLHQIQGSYFGYFSEDDKLQFRTWKEAYWHMMQMILQDGKRLNVKLPYNRIETIIKQKEHLLEAIKVPSLVSFDLWPGNIFVIEDNDDYKIEAIIDFERSFWGDPYADFPPAFMLFKDVRNEKQFWHAYSRSFNKALEITREDYLRMQLYKLYIFLIMSIETYRYGKVYGKLQYIYSRSTVMKCLSELEVYD
ncbi:aminoglycoside phosphotransferase family protein [Paenibacillus tritici]|uniref:Aminoglycoside phosphotransferase family protein n=1 Tax=Paenibacillus tritici TaxID=1873425 RepID=A0ABX2DTI6_9BACL|nr:aminoglycoside phosphotransferase family protein [Paenibacillus tritici]